MRYVFKNIFYRPHIQNCTITQIAEKVMSGVDRQWSERKCADIRNIEIYIKMCLFFNLSYRQHISNFTITQNAGKVMSGVDREWPKRKCLKQMCKYKK